MKKIYFVLMTIMIMFSSVFSNTNVYAKGNATLAASTVSTEKDAASVSVSLNGNSGIWGIKFKVEYDHSALILSSVKNGEIFSDSDVTMPDTLDKREFVYFASSNELDNITGNGVIVTLNFKVADYASEGKYPIKLTLTQAINVDGENIDMDIRDGEVTIVYDIDKDDVIYDRSKDESLTIPSGNSSEIIKLDIDGDVAAPENYKTDKNGDVVISKEHISNLKDGRHKVSIETKEGTTETDFFIRTEVTQDLSAKPGEETGISEPGAEPGLPADTQALSTESVKETTVFQNPKTIIISVAVLSVMIGIAYILVKKIRSVKKI